MEQIPFNRPQLVGTEHRYIDEALASGRISGNGSFSMRCAERLVQRIGSHAALITPSCTAALEMTAILADLQPGDEVIVPSFTFVSTANAFAMRGAVPVFVDIRDDTLNIDVRAVEQAITERTRAIVVVHYGGVACDMEPILALSRLHNLIVIEDAAHALPASLHDRPLGSFGDMATLSFHETKNIQCGEGGALLINDPALVERAEIVQEKGTNRSRFFRGEVDKYTWEDLGSSYLLSDVSAAFLWGQLEQIDVTTANRRAVWNRYHQGLVDLERLGLVHRPTIPDGHQHSGHLYYLLLPTEDARNRLIADLRAMGILAVFHYLPLNSSPGGRRFGRTSGTQVVCESVSARLVRLPLWNGMGQARTERVLAAIHMALHTSYLTA